VGLITLDTYRIGAVEQFKTYAEILGVPFGVILSIKDIPQVIKTMENCEIILIDTMGRNSKNIMQVSEIRKYVEEINANKVHLVISMTTKHKDLKKIINNYRMIKYNSLILTKIDETDVNGSILASLYYSNVPVSYISTGQNVPEDIEVADGEKIIRLVMGAEE
jgi:flagellar biosynthesis protein FlhF